MGTEVLRPHDCFIERFRVPTPFPSPASFSRRRSYVNNHNHNHHSYVSSSVKPSRKPVTRPEQKKRVEKKQPSSDDSRILARSEKVAILRRGESLDSKITSEALKKEGGDGELVIVGTQRLGPDPGLVPIRVLNGRPGCDVYAGSAFAMSPSPSALPLPSFHRKSSSSPALIDNSATRDLRRLLRLE
ncbi:hypothetical protein RIF29_40592 [Crotalaria pallida]|uniref:Uncharacterized protein n=1 Tax=Crotalaria pallida TaxID=3830 RepID=A0AAN9E3E3_CROPI